MNTPIQEAIEQIKEKHLKWFKDKDDLDLTLRERGMQDAYINSIRILESLLEKEKWVIIEAFQEGYKDFERRVEKYDEFQDYYTQNFSSDAEIK